MNLLCKELFPNITIYDEVSIELKCNACDYSLRYLSPPLFRKKTRPIVSVPSFCDIDYFPKTKDAVFYIMSYINDFNSREHIK